MATPSFDALISKLTLQAANIETYKSDVDASAQERADITNDLGNLVYIQDYADVIDGDKKTVTQIKQALFNGDENIAIPVIPTVAAGALPNAAKAGAYQRFQERGKRWKTATGYTVEIGTALGYGGTTAQADPATVKPTIDVFGAATNYHFSIVVSGRHEANMWDVYILRKVGSWTKINSASGKSADISVTPTTPGDAEQIQVRVQLKKNNADYGQVSEPAYVTVNP